MKTKHTEIFEITVTQRKEGIAITSVTRSFDRSKPESVSLKTPPKELLTYLALQKVERIASDVWVIAPSDYPNISDLTRVCPMELGNTRDSFSFKNLGSNKFSLTNMTEEFVPDPIPAHVPAIRSIANLCRHYDSSKASELDLSIRKWVSTHIAGIDLDFGDGGSFYTARDGEGEALDKVSTRFPLKGLRFVAAVASRDGGYEDPPEGDYIHIPCKISDLDEAIQNLDDACEDSLAHYYANNDL